MRVKKGVKYDASVSYLNNWVPFPEIRKIIRDLEPAKFDLAYVQLCAPR